MLPLIGALGTFAGGQAVGQLRERIRPNPYAPRLPDQDRVAVVQSTGLHTGTSGLAGSEPDWYSDQQGVSTIGYLGIVQDIPSKRLPASWLTPGDPGADPSDPLVLADFRDAPVQTDLPKWGRNTGTIPHVITARINPPTAKTPLPREVAASRDPGTAGGQVDPWDGLYEG